MELVPQALGWHRDERCSGWLCPCAHGVRHWCSSAKPPAATAAPVAREEEVQVEAVPAVAFAGLVVLPLASPQAAAVP